MRTAFNNQYTKNQIPAVAGIFILGTCLVAVYDLRIMKKLTESDIQKMTMREFSPDAHAVGKSVRAQLKLGQRIPDTPVATPAYARLDLHHMTEEQAWHAIMDLATSGVRHAQIITGASGILHKKFPIWARESVLTPYILEFAPINNGSFDVRFYRKKSE